MRLGGDAEPEARPADVIGRPEGPGDPPRTRVRRSLEWMFRPGPGLGQRSMNAGLWAFGLSMSMKVLAITRTVVIARLLAPTDVGLMGIALLVSSLLQTFTKTGFKAALVQRAGDITDYLDTAWTVEVARSVLLAGALVAGAPLVGEFFGAPEAVAVVRVIALAVLLQGLANVGVVYFDRELEFQKRFAFRSVPQVVEVAVAVVLAFVLGNVWALVLALVAGRAALVVASYVAHPYRPRLSFHRAKARDLYSFGMWIFASEVTIYFLLNLDDAVVGRVLTVAALGLYQMAFSVSQVMTTEFTTVINQVAFPAYSKLQFERDRLRRAYLKTLQLVGIVAFPMAAGLWFVGPAIVHNVLGDKWAPMLPAFEVLLIWGLIRSILATTGPLFRGSGKPQVQTKLQFFQLVLLAGLIYPLTARWGITGAAWATVVAAVVPDALTVWLAIRSVGGRGADLARLLGFPLLNTGFMVAVLLAAGRWLESGAAGEVLLWAPPLGVAAYGAALLLTRRLFGYTREGIFPRLQRA